MGVCSYQLSDGGQETGVGDKDVRVKCGADVVVVILV